MAPCPTARNTISVSRTSWYTETDLASRLMHPKVMSQFLLADCTGSVDLVSKDQEGNFGQLLDRQQSTELSS